MNERHNPPTSAPIQEHTKYQHLIDACTTAQHCVDLGKLFLLAGRSVPSLPVADRPEMVRHLAAAAYQLGRHHGKLDPLAFLNPLAMPDTTTTRRNR